MQNLQEELIKLLSNEENLVVDNQLNKNKVIESALKVEPSLINLLIKNKTFKKHFFQEVKNVLVFDKIKFQRFVNNKSFLPDSYTVFKNKIGLTIDDESTDNYLKSSSDVVLAWPHKDCILQAGQTKEDQKRNEIFWNESLAPDSIDRLLDAKAFANFKKYDKNGKHSLDKFKGNENLILKGNNLLVISSLLKTHRNKIKLIYIDPPYNTGNDSFQYNDKFNHSTWLTFMKNRLEVAKDLLRDDGVIFVQCDDNEQAYLKVLMDEVFEKENLNSIITVKTSSESGVKVNANKPVKVKEFILTYTKANKYTYKRQFTRNMKFDSNYSYFVENRKEHPEKWKIIKIKEAFKNLENKEVNEKNLYKFQVKHKDKIFSIRDISKKLKEQFADDPNKFIIIQKEKKKTILWKKGEIVFFENKVNLIDGIECATKYLSDIWTDISWDGIANEGAVTLKNGKKPERLLKRIIEMSTDKNDIVLDYHLGSGTTCAVAHKLGRKYIGVEQLDYGKNDSVERIKNVIDGEQYGISKSINWQGGGSFVYAELMQYNEYFIDKIQKSKTQEELISIWKQMQEKSFLSYQFNKQLFNERLDAFKTASLETMQHCLIEVLDKNQLYVNFSEIEDSKFNVSKEDKALNYSFYKK